MTLSMKRILFLGATLACLASCEQQHHTKEDDSAELTRRLVKIEELANDISCNDASEWKFTAYGSKPCGGPQGYIAYPNSIDESKFLALIEEYNKLEDEFNQRWEIYSDCAVLTGPAGVTCENGKPKLEY